MGCLRDLCCVYPTKRMLRVDVWQLGLMYRTLQLGILCGVLYDIFISNAWAYSEVPQNTVNAYGESTPAYEAIYNRTSPPVYCDSPKHDYVFSSQWQYVQPTCHKLSLYEVVKKGIPNDDACDALVQLIKDNDRWVEPKTEEEEEEQLVSA